MDRDTFDDLTRRLASRRSRRSVIGAILGGKLIWHNSDARAAKRRRKQRRRQETSQAEGCTPRRSSRLDGCNYDDAKFEGIDLSSSSMQGTRFQRADLCGANLGSSNLQGASFQGADLTKTSLRSSTCDGTVFDGATLCGTVMCDGTERNDGCPAGANPDDICCGRAGCATGHVCCDRRCRPGNCCSNADCGPTAICEGGICRNCQVCADGCPFRSVRDALRSALPGNTLYVCPGRYFGGFSIAQRLDRLTIVGAGSGDGGTIFDGSRDDFPDAHVVVAAANVTLRDVRITGHVSWGNGGGLLTAADADAVLQRVRIDHNHGYAGGGILNYGYAVLEEGTVVTDNSAYFSGGGVFNQGVVKLVPGSQLSGNKPNDCAGPGQGCPRRSSPESRSKAEPWRDRRP